jgi:hypothetical protein
MAAKQLEMNSLLNDADLDGDGIITDEELAKHERMLKIENDDKKEDQIRSMAWFALWGMLLYPLGIILSGVFGLNSAADLLSDIAPTYFVAISALVATFFGAEAYKKTKS